MIKNIANPTEWLSSIPEHWEIKRAKYLYKVLGGYAFKSEDLAFEGAPLIRIGDLKNGLVDVNNCARISDEFIKYYKQYLLHKDDILIAMTGATIGKVALYKENIHSLLNQRVGKFVTKENKKFLGYVLMSDYIQEQIKLICVGSAQENISSGQLESFYIATLDIEEQKIISNFLDNHIGEIDNKIKKNKQLIKLLEEKRATIINQAVTRGLDPNVKLKDSGIEWIGKIPEHWSQQKLKYSTIQSTEKNISEEKMAYVGLEHVLSKKGELLSKGSSEDVDGDTLSFNKGDVLLGKLRPYLAKVFLAKFSGCCSSEFIVYRPKKYESKFLKYFLLSENFTSYINSITYGVKMPRANPDEINNLVFPLPQKEEQSNIALFIEEEISLIDQIVNKIKRKIKLYEEYKQSLIHHAVTGKIDVRKYKPKYAN